MHVPSLNPYRADSGKADSPDTGVIRVLIADDHLPMLATLARLVGIDCDVIGTVTNGEALVRETRRLNRIW